MISSRSAPSKPPWIATTLWLSFVKRAAILDADSLVYRTIRKAPIHYLEKLTFTKIMDEPIVIKP